MPRSHPPYPAEFRAQAVELVRTSGKSILEVARELGISGEGLRRWVRQAEADAGRGRPGDLTTDEKAELHRLRREIKVLREEREILKKAGGLLRGGERDPVSRYRFIEVEKADHAVSLMCRVLTVSRAGYYAWRQRGLSHRARKDSALMERIRSIHRASRGTYGAPRVRAELAMEGVATSRKRIARLMRASGLSGVRRPRRRVRTTIVNPAAPVAANLVAQNFVAEAPNQLWFGDITYVPTQQGWLYLATLMDCYARRIVGWSMADHLRTELALSALDMAIRRRRPRPGELVHHTDRGCQYTSSVYQAALAGAGITASMSRKGECLDNAVAESFFATLKAELIERRTWRTRAEATQAVFEWVEVFYNRQRLHSGLGYSSPTEYEERVRAEKVA
ncbi:MAG TPA: IS3 family transposase [Bacillota bacterium]